MTELPEVAEPGTRAGRAPISVALLPYQGDQNPYLRLLASSLSDAGVAVELVKGVGLPAARREASSVDLVHLQWHHRLFVPRTGNPVRAIIRSIRSFWQLASLRRKGIRIVWTVHNVVNHERQLEGWELVCCRRLARHVDALIVHCAAARGVVADAYGVEPRKIRVIPHGHYLDWYPDACPRDAARKEWDLSPSSRVFLFFGQIRGYKGVDRLMEAFGTLASADLRLVIAGKPKSPELGDEIRAQAANDPRIVLHLETLDEDRLVSCISASDVVVLPYADSLTSGAAVLASSLGRPVLMPSLGCMGEFPGNASFLYDPAAPGGLGEALRRAADGSADATGQAAREFVSSFDWAEIGPRTRSVYDECLA